MDELQFIRESSQYLGTLLRRPNFSEWLWERKNLYRRYPLTELYADLQGSIEHVDDFSGLLVAFREFKQRHFLRIGGRDLLGRATLEETTSQLSDLASVALQTGLDALCDHPQWWVGEKEKDTWFRLRGDFRLSVLGLGKLGGHELNYVSDIDILLLYTVDKGADGAPSEVLPLVNRLCHWLSHLLGDMVEGDRVFLVDHRLRPQGKDGVLVQSLGSVVDHYLQYGRPWERQAMLKARPVAGDRPLGTAFLQEIRPFVFRRFLDFQALDELRAMRDRILTEAVRPRSGWQQFDVKLGIGGIREVEFFVQSLQLIYGGRYPELDEPNTLRCLDRLMELGLLPRSVRDELRSAYTFLRRVEHWVQLDQNRQTQKLPQSTESKKRLSVALGFEGNVDAFLRELNRSCSTIHSNFLALFHPVEQEETSRPEPMDMGALATYGPECRAYPAEILSALEAHIEPFPASLRQGVREVLTEFSVIKDSEVREKIAVRLERYFSQVRKRPGLLKVFHHGSASWMRDFSSAISRSELLASLLLSNPSLVEGITTSLCPEVTTWQAQCERLLASTDSYEEALEWIRRLKNERLLQLALSHLRGDFDNEALERELTELADFVVRNTYERVQRNLHLDKNLPLCIIGLGKLGSREMGYLSDLDLVFVYDPKHGEPEDRIPSDVIRLTQRLMRMLSTPLHEGPGYAVDARLRPTGNYGPLIATARSWCEYYQEQADLWEIQALLRIRHVAGDRTLGKWVEEKAREVCYRQRDASMVWSRLCHLRQRIQRERAEERGDAIDIKLGMGGLADIEFLVQGRQLVEGFKSFDLQKASVRDALRGIALESAGSSSSLGRVMAGFERLRSLEHRMRLLTNSNSSRVSPSQFELLRELKLWPEDSNAAGIESWQELLQLRRTIRSVLHPFCPNLVGK